MPFDPDAYLAGKHDGDQPQQMAFDPDAYLAAPHHRDNSLINERTSQTALENYGDTLSLGYLPQLQAATEKPMTAILNALTGNDVKGDDYVSARDRNRERIEAESLENPKAALLGKVAGIANQAPLLAGKALQGAGVAQKILSSAKTGAALGALQNPGDEAGEVGLQVGDRLKNSAIGGVTGAAVEGTVASAPYIKKGLQGASEWLGEKAERAAFKALGPYARDAMKSADKGEIEKIGRTLIDNGILKGAPSYETIAERASKATGAKGEELDALIDQLSQKGDELAGASVGSSPNMPASPGMKGAAGGGIDRDLIASKLESDLISPHEGIGGVSSENDRIRKLLDNYREKNAKFMNLRDNEDFKREVGKKINWKRLPDADIPIDEQFNRALYTATKEGSENAADAIAQQVGGDMPDRFRNLKQDYGYLGEAAKMADTRSTKEGVNRFLSPTDYASGGMGMIYGASQGDDPESKLTGALMGAGAGLVNKTLRSRGNPIVAKGLDAASKSLMQIPRFAAIAEKNPALFNSFVQRISSKGREGGYSSLMDQVNRLPVSADSSEKRNPANDPVMTDQAAQDQFIKGNR